MDRCPTNRRPRVCCRRAACPACCARVSRRPPAPSGTAGSGPTRSPPGVEEHRPVHVVFDRAHGSEIYARDSRGGMSRGRLPEPSVGRRATRRPLSTAGRRRHILRRRTPWFCPNSRSPGRTPPVAARAPRAARWPLNPVGFRASGSRARARRQRAAQFAARRFGALAMAVLVERSAARYRFQRATSSGSAPGAFPSRQDHADVEIDGDAASPCSPCASEIIVEGPGHAASACSRHCAAVFSDRSLGVDLGAQLQRGSRRSR